MSDIIQSQNFTRGISDSLNHVHVCITFSNYIVLLNMKRRKYVMITITLHASDRGLIKRNRGRNKSKANNRV